MNKSFILRGCNLIGPLFITLVLCWSLVAYLGLYCTSTSGAQEGQIPTLIFYFILFLMFCWSFIQVSTVSPNYHIHDVTPAVTSSTVLNSTDTEAADEIVNNQIANNQVHDSLNQDYFDIELGDGVAKLGSDKTLQIVDKEDTAKLLSSESDDCSPTFDQNDTNQAALVRELDREGGDLYCHKGCAKLKQNRMAHCSSCQECILKYDHHCPWIGQCIGHANQKLFILFLFYGFLYCLYVFCTVVVLEKLTTQYNTLLLLLFSSVFGMAILVLFVTHLIFCLKNETTVLGTGSRLLKIKGIVGPPILTKRNVYNLGAYNNFTQVFGDDPLLWLLPIVTVKKETGWNPPVNLETITEIQLLCNCSS